MFNSKFILIELQAEIDRARVAGQTLDEIESRDNGKSGGRPRKTASEVNIALS
jgi:hypothetical protein